MPDPLLFGGLALAGGLSEYFRGRGQRKFFEETSGRVDEALSAGAIARQFRAMRRLTGGVRSAGQHALALKGEMRGVSTRASLGRAGIEGGVAESIGDAAETGAAFQSTQLGAAMDLELLQEASALQAAKARAILGLSGTPGAGVDPGAAAIGGAGYGLEAAQNARYSNLLAGKFAQDHGLEWG